MIIGVGTIGSFLALGLNKMGFKNIILVDDDTVEVHNIPTQFYFFGDVGESKVKSLDNYLEQGEITTYHTKVKSDSIIESDVAFICVDSINQRKLIFNAILDTYKKKGYPKLVIDGRMHGLVFRVFTISMENSSSIKRYVEGLMDKEYEGDCGEKGIIQNVYAVTATMIEQFKKILNGEPYYHTLNCDFQSFSFIKNGKCNKEDEKT